MPRRESVIMSTYTPPIRTGNKNQLTDGPSNAKEADEAGGIALRDDPDRRQSSPPEERRPKKASRGKKGTGQPLERKEIQRRYRERLKQQLDSANGGFRDLATEYATLSREYQALQNENEALQNCLAYADAVAAVLSRCRLDRPIFSHPDVGAAVFSAMWEGKACPEPLIRLVLDLH